MQLGTATIGGIERNGMSVLLAPAVKAPKINIIIVLRTADRFQHKSDKTLFYRGKKKYVGSVKNERCTVEM